MAKSIIVLLAVLAALVSCDQQSFLDTLIPEEEAEFAKQYLAYIQSRDFDAIERNINPTLKNAQLRPKLEQIAVMFPDERPKNVQIVGSQTFTNQSYRQSNFAFQYEFPSKWLLANITVEKRGGVLTVNSVNIQPLEDSLENIHRFTLQGKGAVHYVALALALLVPVFIVFAIVLGVRTPIPKRKWLWMIFILLGFLPLTLNWTTGDLNINPLSFLLLGAALWKAGPFAPVVVSVAIPLGAIIFLLKRKKWLIKSK